jgi:hypothetical protein
MRYRRIVKVTKAELLRGLRHHDWGVRYELEDGSFSARCMMTRAEAELALKKKYEEVLVLDACDASGLPA